MVNASSISWSSMVVLMRPQQYVKNLFIFLPAFFALRLTDLPLMARTLGGFVAFCAVASAIYVLNDYADRKADRLHPTKRKRPLAAGRVSPRQAAVLGAGLILLGALGFTLVDPAAGLLAAAYVLLNVAYSLWLKHLPIVDILVIAVGFVLRLFVGAEIGEILLSQWIIIMTFLLALLLALAKRRDDLLLAEGRDVRRALDGYNLDFVNGALILMASVTLVAYILYTLSPDVQAFFGSQYVYFTSFWVLMGILRYLQITFVEERSGNPTQLLLRDRFLQLTLLGWGSTFLIILYF